MGRIEKTVFISYRRTNYWTALAIFQNLNANGYDAFFDYKSIPSGDFEQAIIENIKSRAHFIVILSPSALERCNEPGDWLRREMETAIDHQRNIIPLMMEGFDFGSPSTLKALTGKLDAFKNYNGLGIPAEYFDEAMTKLRSERFLNKPLESVLHPIAEITRQVTKEQKSTASEAAPVEAAQLTAEEWFERGYVFQKDKSFDEAIRCYKEVIHLEPELSVPYNNLGVLFGELERYAEAEEAYRNAIAKDPNDAAAYSNLGLLLRLINRNEDAIPVLEKLVEIDPDNGVHRSSLMAVLKKAGRTSEAKQQEEAARKLIEKENEYNRACFESLCENKEEALTLLKTALEKGQSSKEWARQDPDFENIRSDPRFKELVGE